MAKKTVEINMTPGDDRLEHEANEKRISAPKYKSERGERKARLTVLLPESLHEEMSMYATVTKQSMGDIINDMLEEFVADPKNKAKIDAQRKAYESAE
jgi:hypothetical protein